MGSLGAPPRGKLPRDFLCFVPLGFGGERGGSKTFRKKTADGSVTAFHGHVDLGTGIRTALGQIVAEELDVAFGRVRVVLGDTSVTPDFGPTIASETIQVTSAPLRRAAAQARQHLVAIAAQRLGADPADLVVQDGLVRFRTGDNRSVSYGELLEGARIRLALSDEVETKPVADYRIVG